MKYRTGFHDISEEEIKSNEKYLKIREIIKAEELVMLLKKEAEIKLQKYNKVFEKIGKIEGEGFFSGLNTEVDIDRVKKLTIKFWSSISPEYQKEVEDIFSGVNPNVQLVIYEDDERFVADHSRLKIKGQKMQFPEEMLETIKNANPDLYNQIVEMSKDKNIISINLSLTGSLNDIYNLVHETTHYLTFNDTATERIFSEVAPQCMERNLDEFLLQLSDEELNKYGFEKEELRNDIRKRRIISFASRYKATREFIENNDKNGDEKEELLQYFLAQFFQAQFRRYDEKDKKILEFIEYVKNDNFEMATKTFGVDWSNGLKRKIYIDNIIEDVQADLERKQKDKTVNENNKRGEKEQEEK